MPFLLAWFVPQSVRAENCCLLMGYRKSGESWPLVIYQLVALSGRHDVGLHTVAHQQVTHFRLQVRYPWICMGSYSHNFYASPLSMAASNCSLL